MLSFYCMNIDDMQVVCSDRIAVSTEASHASDPGSIPGSSKLLIFVYTNCIFYVLTQC